MNKSKKQTLHIYLDSPTSNTHLKKFFPNNLKKLNFNLKYLNTAYLNFDKKKVKDYYKNSSKKDRPKNLIKVKNKHEFENYLKLIKPQDYVLIQQRGESLKNRNNHDLKMFQNYNIKTISIERLSPWVKSNFKKNFLVSVIRSFHKYFKSLFRNFDIPNGYEPTYVLGCGDAEKRNFKKKKFTISRYINCPSLSIDFTLSEKKKKNIITYVDENLFFSRDDLIYQVNYKKIKDIDLYLKHLNCLFKKVENKFNAQVIIACSNKFTYKKNPFKKQIIYGKTHQLISQSKLVLGHRSSALFQALYNKVPTIFIKYKNFPILRNFQIQIFANTYFNQTPYYLDNLLLDWNNIKLKIDRKYCNNILREYFKSDDLLNKNFKDNFVKTFNSLI
jgi:hypothetical protein